jgi:hypothetical protein
VTDLLEAIFREIVFMVKLMAWLGVYVGTPSLASYATLSFQDNFVVFFAFFVAAGLLAILPLLWKPSRH